MNKPFRHNQITGAEGEDIATEFLEDKGYMILDRNYRFMRGEVDIIAYVGREIVFVEVKTRNSSYYGTPEEAVSEEKKKQIKKVAEAWLHERKMEGAPVRFDVIAILKPKAREKRIKHFEGAFWYL
ncbi:MAG: YraN family protein [Balneolales bacterium]